MLNIVLFGPPGAGKGTQSRKLIEKYNLVHLSTGDLLREEINHGTELGLRARSIMDRGELVSDDIVIGMIESRLDSNAHAKGFIFDGFPRTQAQAEALDDLLQKKGTAISAMLALEVSDDELTRRLLLRGKESGRPDDQNEMVIRNRVNEYNNKTLPLVNYYSEQGKFHAVKGTGSIEEIFDALSDRITFIQAEIELTNLENDIEHLDLTINDFEVATEISPELQKDMDEVRNLDKQPKAAEKHEPKSIVERIKETVNHFFHKDSKEKAPAKPAKKEPAKPAKKAAAPKKKTAAPAKKTARKAVKKSAPKKVAAKKKLATKKAAKPVKKAVAKKALKKAAPKKQAVKKAIKKAAKPVKKALKKAMKKAAPKKALKKGVKKAMKAAPKKAMAKKKPLKKAIKAAVKKAAPKKKTAPKKALKKVIKKKK